MKAVIYARVGSHKQIENSIEEQINVCENYTKENIENNTSKNLLESILVSTYKYYSQKLNPDIKEQIKQINKKRIANGGY